MLQRVQLSTGIGRTCRILVQSKHIICFVGGLPTHLLTFARKSMGEYRNLKRYGITLQEVAEALGYSSVESLRNSSAKERVLKGLDELLGRVRDRYRDRVVKIFE